jgi:hypothetical protein
LGVPVNFIFRGYFEQLEVKVFGRLRYGLLQGFTSTILFSANKTNFLKVARFKVDNLKTHSDY